MQVIRNSEVFDISKLRIKTIMFDKDHLRLQCTSWNRNCFIVIESIFYMRMRVKFRVSPTALVVTILIPYESSCFHLQSAVPVYFYNMVGNCEHIP